MYNIDLQLILLFLQKEMLSYFDMFIVELILLYQVFLELKESKLFGGFCVFIVIMNLC